MRQHLGEVSHIDERPTNQAIAEMISLGSDDAVRVAAGIARDHKVSSIGAIAMSRNNRAFSLSCSTRANLPYRMARALLINTLPAV
jgi:hypothetical protein